MQKKNLKRKNLIDSGFTSPRQDNKMAGFFPIRGLYLVQSAKSRGQEVTRDKRLLPQGVVCKTDAIKYASMPGLMKTWELYFYLFKMRTLYLGIELWGQGEKTYYYFLSALQKREHHLLLLLLTSPALLFTTNPTSQKDCILSLRNTHVAFICQEVGSLDLLVRGLVGKEQNEIQARPG